MVSSPRLSMKGSWDPLLERAADAPWSIDPRTPEGHRNYVIVRSELAGKGESAAQRAYLVFAATQVARDTSVHCDKRQLTLPIVRLFLRDKKLSQQEWQTIKAMVTRTPPTGQLRDCLGAFKVGLESDVPIEERARWLADLDCSTSKRHKARLGRGLRSAMYGLDRELRDALERDHGACLKR
jgi:hypothetical protein